MFKSSWPPLGLVSRVCFSFGAASAADEPMAVVSVSGQRLSPLGSPCDMVVC